MPIKALEEMGLNLKERERRYAILLIATLLCRSLESMAPFLIIIGARIRVSADNMLRIMKRNDAGC